MKSRPNPFLRSALLLATVAVAITHTAQAAGTVTWKSGGTANWNVAGNWTAGTGGTAPPATGDSLAFGTTTGVTTLNNDITSGSFAALTFNAGANAYTLNGNAITLTGNITNSSSNLQTINLASATTAVRTVTTNASGNITLGGVISGTNGGITKTGAGTLSLTAANTYTGATTVNLGTLLLDFSAAGAPATNIINTTTNSSALTLGGGILNVKLSNSATANTQRFNGLTLTASTNSSLLVNQNGNSNSGSGITLAGITRNAGSTLDLTLPTTGGITTTSTTFVSNSILVSAATNGIAYATSGGTNWVTNTAGTLGALSSYATGNANYTSTNNVDVTNLDSVSGVTVNTLRFNGNNALTLTGTNTISTGGILVTSAANTGASITGGTLQAGGGKELVIINNGVIDIGSNIIDNSTASAVTISGSGVTTLSGTNSYTGNTVVLGGTLKAGTGATQAFGVNSAVTLLNTAGVTLALNDNNNTIGSLAGGGTTGGTVALGTGNLTIKATTNNQTYGGLFTGSGKIVVDATTSTNVVNFGGTNTAASTAFTGNVEVKSGILSLGKTSNILGTNSSGAGTQSITVSSGATARLAYGNAAYDQRQNFIISGTGADSNGALQATTMAFGNAAIGGLAVAANSTVRVNRDSSNSSANYLNVVGALAGTGDLTLSGAGTTKAGYIQFSAAAGTIGSYSAFSGNINLRDAITLTSNNATALGTVGKLDIADGTSFALGASQTIGALTETTASTFTGTVSLGTSILTIGNASNLDSVFSGIISSGTAGGVTKAGSGTLTLKGANLYTGATSVQNGTLQLTGSLSASTALNLGDVSNNSGKFILGSSTAAVNQSVAGLSITGTGINNAIVGGNSSVSRLTVTNAIGTSVFSGKLGGSLTHENNLALTKSGAGALTLSGDNTFTGGVVLQGDTAARLNINSATALGTGTFAINSGDLARIDATNTFGVLNTLTTNNAQTWANNFEFVGTNNLNMGTGAVTLGGNRTVTVTAKNLTIGGVIDDGASTYNLVKAGAGTMSLTGTNTYDGATNVTTGILNIQNNSALGSTTGETTVTNNARLELQGGITVTGETLTITGPGGSGYFTGALNSVSGSNTWAGSLKIGDTGTTRIGSLAGATLTVSGDVSEVNANSKLVVRSTDLTGKVILSGNNSYKGSTDVIAGVLEVRSNGALGTTDAGTVVSSGQTLQLANNITVTGEALSITGAASSITAPALNNLSGNNTWTGALTVGNTVSFARIGSDAGKLTYTGTVALSSTTSNALVLQGNGDMEFSNVVSGASRLWSGSTGTGIRTLSGANTYTGATSINGGTLSASSLNSVVTNTSALLASSSLGAPTTNANGTIGIGSAAVTGRLLYTGTGETTNRTLALYGETGGAILDQSGSGLLKFTSNLESPGVATKDVRKTLTLQGSAAGTGEIEGIIADSLLGTTGQLATSLTKAGSGTWTLSGINTYSGDTTITTGTLALTGTGSIASSANLIVNSTLDVSGITAGTFTVGSTQKLSGDGTITATGKTLSIEGTHAVGNSPGQQDITGNVSYASTSIFEWDLAANADTDGYDDDANPITPNSNVGARGTDFDAVDITGTLAIDSAAVFKVIQNAGVTFSNPFWAQNQEWSNIFTYAGSTPTGWSNTAVSVYNTSNILQDVSVYGAFTINGSTLTWSAVPEPTSALVGLLIGAGLLRRRRQC